MSKTSILDYINENPKETKRLVGLEYENLQNLIQQLELRHQAFQSQQEVSKKRIIAPGGGRKPLLSIPEQILLTLVYLRQHLTFQMLGLQFGVSESTAHNLFHYWLGLLQEVLPASLFIQLESKQGDWEVVQELLAALEIIVDSSEQERERPQNPEERKKYYSGYKKKLV